MTNVFNIASLIVISILITYILILNRRLKKLRIKEIYLEYLLKYVPLGIYFKDLSGKIKLVNNEFSKITKTSKNELINKTVYDIFPNMKNKIDEDDSLIRKKKQPVSFETNITLNEYESFFRIVKSPVINIEGKVIGFIVLFKNINAEKEVEANKESFIATLTHDLKTPTYAQLNTLKMLLNENFGTLTPYQKEILELSKGSCVYTLDLISTILDTYCYDNGRIKLNNTKFDIINLIYTLCKGLEGLTKEKSQTIIFEHKDTECFINADMLQIKRVIVNMLSNAITYGNKASNIKIKLKNDNNILKISIINKSEPIPEKDLSTMFNRFKETKLSCYNKASTGLGLYLSKQIIDMHKGEIFVKSYKDGTCIFGFKLPKDENKNNKTEQMTSKQNKKLISGKSN